MICCVCGKEAYVKLGELSFCLICLEKEFSSYCPFVSVCSEKKNGEKVRG